MRAISAPFKRPATRTLIPLQPKRSAESTALRMARRKGYALFQLQRDRFRYQRGIQLRTVHFHDVDVHFALGALTDFLLQRRFPRPCAR